MHAAYTRASPTHAQVTTSHHRGQTHTTLTITYTVRCRMIIYLSSLDHYFCCGVTAHVIGTPKGISGFGGLVSLNTLTITNNPTLQSVTGFGAVQSVVLLTISDNKSLTSLAGVRARHACSDQHHALCLRINARGTHFTTRAAGGPRVCVCVCVCTSHLTCRCRRSHSLLTDPLLVYLAVVARGGWSSQDPVQHGSD